MLEEPSPEAGSEPVINYDPRYWGPGSQGRKWVNHPTVGNGSLDFYFLAHGDYIRTSVRRFNGDSEAVPVFYATSAPSGKKILFRRPV
jgi:hypothetical protein